MAAYPPQDPLARERARKRRAQQIRRRRLVLVVCLLGLVILIVGLAVGLSGDSDQTANASDTVAGSSTTTTLGAMTFTATLTGEQSVPPVETTSTGKFTMSYDPVALTLTYSLTLDGLSNPSSAALYEGAPGTTGTAVYVLFAGPTKTATEYEGELASGTIEAGKLTGSLAGGTIQDLVALIRSGNTYVSVGNTSHPVDAIRGQIK